MSYDLHITRAEKHWTNTSGHGVLREEWLALVALDADLTLAPQHGPNCAVWAGPSREKEPVFDWRRGNVYTHSADPAVLRKALEIAVRLDAQVQGDDGEFYMPGGKVEREGRIDHSPALDWRKW